ncbi:unnamed protein product, partial [Phaeothamnion confervicola]
MDRSILARATSSDDSPTPGYLYGEIAAMTKASYADCQKVQAFLLERIKKKNHNVKHKCLLIIKHVCQKGRPDFKREMQRGIEDVKECISFTGPPDSLRGDEIYRRVREAARETLEVVYSDQVASNGGGAGGGYLGGGGGAYGSAYASGNRIEGFGSGMATTVTGSGAASSSAPFSGYASYGGGGGSYGGG